LLVLFFKDQYLILPVAKMRVFGKFFCVLWLVLMGSKLSWGQVKTQDIQFRNLGTRDGLAYPKVFCVLQDSKGFLWFGTKNGLDFYDGYSFRSYKAQPNPGLSGNHIQALFEDRDGLIWVGTRDGGLSRFDRRTGLFQAFRHDPNNPQSLPSDDVLTIGQDREGQVWVGTRGGGLSRFDANEQSFENLSRNAAGLPAHTILTMLPERDSTLWLGTMGNGLINFDPRKKTFTCYRNQPGDAGSLPGDDVYALYQDRMGNLWVGTGGQGMARFDRSKNAFKTYAHEAANPNSLSSDFVLDVQEDALGMLWVATKGGGLCRMDVRKEFFTTFLRNPADLTSLSHNDVTNLMLDKAGILWITTDGGGVCRFESRSQQVFNAVVSDDSSSFVAHSVTALFEDGQKDLWIGTQAQGLYLFDRKERRFNVFRNDTLPIGRTDAITGICEDNEGAIWIGTASRGLVRYDRQSRRLLSVYKKGPSQIHQLPSDSILNVFKDRNGNMWVGTTAGLCRFDAATRRFVVYTHDPANPRSIVGNAPRTIYEAQSGHLWIGDRSAGLSVFDPKTYTFEQFQHQPGTSGSLSSNAITSIVEAKDGQVWVGTVGGGISKFDPRTRAFNNLTSNIGLLDNVICGLLKDNQNSIWISTPKGLSCYHGTTRHLRHYKVEQGLPGNEFTQQACFRSGNGELYFGGRENFIYFQPPDLTKNPYQAPVYLTAFRLFDEKKEFNKLLSEVEVIELAYNDNFFSFEFALLDYLDPEQNRYTYKMEGFDKGWNYIGNRRFASYTNLDPGQYVFRVKAAGKNGIWNETGTSIRIIIHPAWYHTWWFRTLVAFSVIGAGWSYYRYRIRTIEKQKAELEVQVAERTADLHEEKAKLEQAYDEINAQKEELQRQSYHITSSINYAKRIQEAMLPLQEEIKQVLPDSFILYKPRDTVSGDFYWFARKGEVLVLAVVDCTGHGVPGAFMSMVGNSLLNQVVKELNIIRPSEILRRLHHGVREALKQDDNEGATPDGMDIALCVINPAQRIVEFAGANRPLWYITSDSIEEVKPTGGSIGGLMSESEGVYTYHFMEVEQPTSFYLFSDGYADQFGSEKKRKFMLKNFKQQLLDVQMYDFDFQKEVLEQVIENWKGDSPQIDDMLVVGFRL